MGALDEGGVKRASSQGKEAPSPVHHPSPSRKPSPMREVEKTLEEAERQVEEARWLEDWVGHHHCCQPDS